MMDHWRNDYAAFGASEALRALLLDPCPALVFARGGDRLVWANSAGGRLFGAERFADLARLRFGPGSRLRRALRHAQQGLSTKPRLARLNLPGGGPAAGPRLCTLARVTPSRGEGGILVVEHAAARAATDHAALVEYLAADDTAAVIYDETGAALAGAGPGPVMPDPTALLPLGDIAAGQPILRTAFDSAGRTFTLLLADRSARLSRAPDPAPSRPEPGPPPKPRPPEPEDEAPASAEADRRIRAGLAIGADESEAAMLRRALAGDGAVDDEAAESNGRGAAEPAPGAEPQPDPATEAGRSLRRPDAGSEPQRSAVRFLWQTDAEHRVLFVSPGLQQTVGRSADIVGEVWIDAAHRLRLDPNGRIWHALKQRDTWSGLTAWWPVEETQVRIPAELTALPVFGIDQSFQGFRGFGVLKPAEALTPAAFDQRYGPGEGDERPRLPAPDLYEEGMAFTRANVVPLHGDGERAADLSRLTQQERKAFEEIASKLNDRVDSEAIRHKRDTGANEPTLKRPSRPASDAQREQSGTEEPPGDGRLRAGPVGPGQGERPIAEPPDETPMPLPTADETRHPSVEELIAILNTATDGVLIVNGAGVIEDLNGSAEALFSVDKSATVGRHFAELLTDDSRQEALDYLSGLRGSGVASVINEGREVEGRAGEGAIPLFMTMGRIGEGGADRYCAVLRDITPWKRAEADLVAARRKAEQASSHKSDFLARVSHEIRTPLNAIIGFAEVMIEERFGPVDNERYRDYLRDIRTSGEHVVSLVNDLLDISKIEAGKLDLNFTAVPLNELVRECITLMQTQANRAHVVLRASLSADVPAVVADQRTLRQIVLNLLSNSIKFTGPGGQVITSTSMSKDGEAVLRVRDTGRGMSAEDLERALEPFRQISTAALGDRGTGLGLPLTKALAEANRAAFSIESTKGEGTIVRIAFPPTRVLSE